MMGREPLPTLGNVSWHLAGHYKIIVLDPSLPRHGRCWAKPIQSGCAVAEETVASLRGDDPTAATPLYGRYLRLAGHWWEQKLSKRETRRPLGGAQKQANLRQRIQTWDSQATGESFLKQNLGMKVKSWKQLGPKSPPEGQQSPDIAPRWANVAPT